MSLVIAAIGAKALYLLYAWLASAIISSYLSNRKGYGEKPGLGTGLILSVLGVLIWLVWPARPDSRWKLQGAFGRRAIIGLSVKTVEQAKAAPLELLDYVAIGGIYGTTSKDNTVAPIGTDGLRTIVDAVRARKANFPICAIAGINATNASDVIAAGADGVAVISALSLAPDPAKAAQELRGVVDQALRRRGRS